MNQSNVLRICPAPSSFRKGRIDVAAVSFSYHFRRKKGTCLDETPFYPGDSLCQHTQGIRSPETQVAIPGFLPVDY